MNLHQVIGQIAKRFENTIIGDGNKFTTQQIQKTENFIEKYSFLKSDLDYCKYLKEISALSYFDSDEDFTLLGFDANNTVLFAGGEYNEELIDGNGFFLFGYYNFIKERKVAEFYFYSGTGSAYGVYANKKHDYQNQDKSYHLICHSFLEFLVLVSDGDLKEKIGA